MASSYPTDAAPDAGLCGGCRHAHCIRSDRGQAFLRCRRSERDEAYPRYPRLPVAVCRGFEPTPPPSGTSPRRHGT